MKKLWSAIRNYIQFSIALLSLLIALGLAIAGEWTIAHWVLGIAAGGLCLPLLWEMIQEIRVGTYGVDILALSAIISAIVFKQFWAAIVIVLMLTGGEALENYAERRATTELDALLRRAPKFAHIYKGRKLIDVPISEVQIGSRLVVKAGEVLPVDGVITEGVANLDESSITGESLPQIKKVSELALSGTVNLDSPITIKALHTAADSQYEQIIRLVRAARHSQAPFVRLADRYSVPFTIISFVIAGAAWFLSGQAIRFLEVLVVATPCPLILAAPIAVISGMSRSAKQGIIVKTGGTLEKLAKAPTFAFDKTGTLTVGRPMVDSIKTFDKYTVKEVTSLALALEQNSNHILAQAIVSWASKKKIRPAKAKQLHELPGHGVRAVVGRDKVIVGRVGLSDDFNIEFPASFKPESVQQTSALVAVNNKLVGLISFKDEIRPEAASTLKRLTKLGINRILMLTGDNQAVAKSVAKTLKIKTVVAAALPKDKIEAIEKLPKNDRPAVFVGDGVNDAPVLTASDVGIALGARGSTAASESADMVIMQDDLSKVVTAVEIAMRTFRIAKQSILVGIALSIALMLIFATGKFKPLYGAIIQEVVDIVVIFNALRAHSESKNSKTAA